ncbi:MAG TPA: flagellar hook-associated family protein [Rhodoblastus sp.]|mgnify:CR=1 FL=1|nr:flagellar hook-associated family protein [Rhodoblastus sp.]
MITTVSTATAQLLTRATIGRLQSELSRAQQELSSGRHSDIGLALGYRSGADASLRAQIATKDALIASDNYLTARFGAVDDTLGAMTKVAQSLQQALLSTNAGGADASTIGEQAKAALKQVVSLANTTFDGSYLFAGLSNDGSPLNDVSFDTADGPGAAVNEAFQARFGARPGDSATSAVSGADMQSFLDTEFTQLFNPGNWATLWAHATDNTGESWISESLSLTSSATAASPAMRDLMKSLTMLAGLGLPALGADARSAVVAQATSALGQSIQKLTDLSSDVGLKKALVQDANDELQAQKVQLQNRLSDIESVDTAEVSVRLSTLSTQLQASYQTTAKLANLSLVNFI